MITNQNEYLSKLHLIQDKNNIQNTVGNLPPIPIPESKPLLKVDLNTRQIEAPEFLSVELDSNAEVFFFEMDRFYNHIDLALTSCVVQYKTPTGSFIYPVPFYDTVSNDFISIDLDVETYKKNYYYILNIDTNSYELATENFDTNLIYFEKQRLGKIYIPWQISRNATQTPGEIEFNLRFFLVNADNWEYEFNLSTLSAKSKILSSITYSKLDLDSNEEISEATDLDELLQRVKRIEREYELYWIELD